VKRIRVLLLISCLLSLTGCAKWKRGNEDDNGPYQKMSAKRLFTESQQALANGQFDSAAKRLEAMESLYPFSDYSEQAQMDLIYAYYKKGDYPSAAATAERFIHLYPRAKHVDYAYYMRGLANFRQTRGTFVPLISIDESWREPGTQVQAYTDFADFLQKFPDSPYKADALKHMIYLRNMFAQRELNTAKYYYVRKMYVAAAERASFLVKNYPQAPSAQQALAILYNANKRLCLQKAADDALAVYQATYHQQPPSVIRESATL
jgi:outer membrane protein assembly factor BamD